MYNEKSLRVVIIILFIHERFKKSRFDDDVPWRGELELRVSLVKHVRHREEGEEHADPRRAVLARGGGVARAARW